MSRDFRYKDYVNKLRFKLAGAVCPVGLDEYWDKLIKDYIYNSVLSTAKAVYANPEISPEACEIITRTIGEWTVCKLADIINGQVPECFFDTIINKINSEIYDYLIDENKLEPLTEESIENPDRLKKLEEVVQNIYRETLAQIYSDRGIDKDVYTLALSQSFYSEKQNQEQNQNQNQDTQEENLKTDKFVSEPKPLSEISKIKKYLKNNPCRVLLLFVFIVAILFLSLVYFGIIPLTKEDLPAALMMLFLGMAVYIIDIIIEADQFYRIEQNAKFSEDSEKTTNSAVLNSPNGMYERLGVDILSIRLGTGLLNYVDPECENIMLPLISEIRKELTDELGYIIPKVRCLDDKDLKPDEFRIYVRGVVRDKFFAGKNAKNDEISNLLRRHLRECCIKNVKDILTRTDVIKLMEIVNSEDPTLVNDLIPARISAVDLRRILVSLISEEIPVKDVILIFERLCDYARFNTQPYVLAESLRAAMAARICDKYSVKSDTGAILYTVTLNPELEKTLSEAVQYTEFSTIIKLPPDEIEKLITDISETISGLKEHKEDVVLLVQPKIRKPLFDLLSLYIENIKVISYSELLPVNELQVEKLVEI